MSAIVAWRVLSSSVESVAGGGARGECGGGGAGKGIARGSGTCG